MTYGENDTFPHLMSGPLWNAKARCPENYGVSGLLDASALTLRGVQDLDPGAAVALGAPMVVRVFVPLWVVNATPLPVSALVVVLPPPPKVRRVTYVSARACWNG